MVLDEGVNIDVQTDDGTTALHFAAYSGALAACKWLIFEGKCDINKMNSYGCNASQWCVLCKKRINML
jgi:ankyrin repeat protein